MIYIFWTSVHKEEAVRIVEALLEKKLIACASILPEVESIFCWKGKIEHSKEAKTILKTRPELFEQVRTFISERCSYEVPEIAQVSVDRANPSYLKWISEETTRPVPFSANKN